jgi:hypothetical protein
MSNEISNPGFSPKDPRETIIVSFNFAALTSAPLSPVLTVARHAGADDPTPSAIKSGSPSVSGPRVLQAITGGVAGTDYVLTCQIDVADGSRYILSGVLPVRGA